jgi:RecA-family ATPase
LRVLQEQALKISIETDSKETEIFSPVTEFVKLGRGDVEWRVERIIEKGTNGLIQALPKTGKSMMTCYLAACLATGYPFFDLDVRRCRVALISREDNPGTTARRLYRIFKGMGMDPEQNVYGNWLYVNSRAQSKSMMLDNPADLASLIKNLQRKNSEFAVLDVFNTMHQKKENDPTEMAGVMAKVKHIHAETGCQICVVHHVRKGAGEDSLSERGRGTNAIAGFAEFIIDLDMADEEKEIRQARFLTKAAGRLNPFYWSVKDLDNVSHN